MNPFATTMIQQSTAEIDTAAAAGYNENDIRQIAAEEAQRVIVDFFNTLMTGVTAQLDNSTSQTQSYPDDNRLTLSVEEVADQLGVSKPTAYGLINDGTIRSIKIGRKIIVPRDAVTDFLSN